MIGDNIATTDLSTLSGSLPDHTSQITTVVKVNNDNFGSEYRLRGAAHDYLLKVRNSVESPRNDGVQFTRHNVEFTVTERGDPLADPPTKDVPYIASLTVRMPKGGDADLMRAIAGHTGYRFAVTGTAGSNLLLKMFNFES